MTSTLQISFNNQSLNLQMRILIDRIRLAFMEFYGGQQIFITQQEGQLKLSLTITSSPDLPILSLERIFNLLHEYFAQENERQCRLTKDLVQRRVQFHSLCANLVDQYQSFLTFALQVAKGSTTINLVFKIKSLEYALSRLKSQVEHYFQVLERSLKTYVEDELEEFLKEFNVPVISKISLEKFLLNISEFLQHIPGSGWKLVGLQRVGQFKVARLLHHIEALDLSIFHYTEVATGFSVVSTRSAFHREIEKPVIDQLLDLNLLQLLILLYRKKGQLIDFCQELSESLEILPSQLCSFVVYDKQDLSLELTIQAQIHHQLKMFIELMKLLRSSTFNIFNYKNPLFSFAIYEICSQYSSNNYFCKLLKILVQMSSFSNDLLRCGSNCAQVLQKMQVDFAGCDFASIRLSNINLSKANFLGANLQRSQLSNVDITGADFQLCNLNYVNWSAVECCQTPLIDRPTSIYENKKVCFTVDCKFIYQLSNDKVQYWERLRGRRVDAYTVRRGSKMDFAISQSGLLLAISHKWSAHIRLYQAKNGRLVRKLFSTHLLLQDLSFSSDDRLLVAKGNSGGPDQIFIWDLRTSSLIFQKESEQNNPSVFVKFVPNSHCLYYALHKGEVKILSVGGSHLEISEGLKIPDSILLMTISKEQRKLAYLAENDLVSIWRVDSWKRQLTLPHKQKKVVFLEFTLDSSELLIARCEFIQAFSALNSDLLWHLNFLQFNASIAYSQELNLMVGVSYHHQFSLWDLEKLKNCNRASGNLFLTNTLCFSQNSQFLISGGQDSVLRYIDVSKGKVVSCVAMKLSGIDQIYASRCSDQILILSGKHLVLFELGLGQEIWRKSHKGKISQAAYSRDGSCIGFVDRSNSIFLLEVLTGDVQQQIQTEENDLFLLAISDDGGKAAVANSWTLLLWSLIAGKGLQVFPLRKLITNICFFHSLPIESQESRLVCAFRDGSVVIYGETEPCCKLKAKNPKRKIQNVRFLNLSCDNQLLLVCTKDCNIQIWDLNTRDRLFGEKYPSMKAKQMILSPCMKWAALCSTDNLIRLWSLTYSPKSEKNTTLKLSAKQNLPLSLASFSSDTSAQSANNFLCLLWTLRGDLATLFCGAQFNDSSTLINSKGLTLRQPNIQRTYFERKDIL